MFKSLPTEHHPGVFCFFLIMPGLTHSFCYYRLTMQVKQTGNKGLVLLFIAISNQGNKTNYREVNSLGVRVLQLSLGCQVLLEFSPSFFCKTWARANNRNLT